MIQRVQTLYLLATSGLMAASAMVKLAYFSTPNLFYDLRAMGLYSNDGTFVESTKYMIALFSVSAILPLVNIFLFNNRKLQIKLCLMGAILLLSSFAMMCTYVYMIAGTLGVSGAWYDSFQPASAMVILALPFTSMALRAIKRDEELVRSLDRIR